MLSHGLLWQVGVRGCLARNRGMWEELSGVSSYEDTNPIRKGPTFMTSLRLNYLLRSPISMVVRASIYECEGGQTFSP